MKSVNVAPLRVTRLSTLGMKRNESASKSSIFTRMMLLRDAASAGWGGKKVAESRVPRSKTATTLIRMDKRRVTAQFRTCVAKSETLNVLTTCRLLVYGV
jgi:hypothetical protein